MNKRYRGTTKLKKLSDNEKLILRLLDRNRKEWGKYASDTVIALEEKVLLDVLRGWNHERQLNHAAFQQEASKLRQLKHMANHPVVNVQRAARSLCKHVNSNWYRENPG